MSQLKNLIKLNSKNQFIRMFCNLKSSNTNQNYAETMPVYLKQREALLKELLKKYRFDDNQQENVCKFVFNNQILLTDQDLARIDNSIQFWKKYIHEQPIADKKTGELKDHLHILSTVEPSLLFIDCVEMKKRVNLVQNSGFVDSKSDVSNLFMKAPKAIFLQQWSDVILKAYYIHHRVLDWILNKKPICLYPHPIVKHPKVMELSYEDIKTRFLFAKNSGYRSKGIFQDLSTATPYDVFRDLMITDFDTYLNNVCKGLTIEEYDVYKEMIRLQFQEEDDVFRELSKLNDSISSDYAEYKE